MVYCIEFDQLRCDTCSIHLTRADGVKAFAEEVERLQKSVAAKTNLQTSKLQLKNRLKELKAQRTGIKSMPIIDSSKEETNPMNPVNILKNLKIL